MTRYWPQRLVFATIVLLTIAVGASAVRPAGAAAGTVVNIAHRGGIADGYPENTLAAFRRAMAVGADVIELDIRGTKDSRLVILHDETLDRTTDGAGPVTDFTLEELEELSAGSNEGIPTLEEVLQLVAHTGTQLLLDIKSSPLVDKREIVRLVEKYRFDSDLVLGVRNLDDFAELHKLNPQIRTLGFVTTPFEIEEFADAGVDIIRLWAWWLFLYPELMKKTRQLQMPVWVTAGDASRRELEWLMSLGVDGIITDHPEILAELKTGMKAAEPVASLPGE